LQEPEDKQKNKEEGKPLSEQNTQQDASTQPGQGVISNAYTASEEVESKEWTYEDLMNQLQNLEKQIKQVPSASYAELAALKRKLADLNKEIAKRATMRDLSKKISELSKQLQQPEDEEDSESEETEAAEAESAESKRASGKDTVDTIQDAA
jgi:polyhydroxyalkanoate synthesis regulator phasin